LSGWHTEANQLRTLRIHRTKAETPEVKTFFFRDELCASAKAGQFIMLWIPSVDEIPLSLSSADAEGLSSVTVAEVGEATRVLNAMKEGDFIGVRGPFGKYFKIIGKEALIVGGGIGMAPLLMLIRDLLAACVKTTVIEGVETRDHLLFLDYLKSLTVKADAEVIFTTEDGSYGIKGIATDALEKVLSSRRFDMIYTCGPEKMIREVYFLAKLHETPLQASLERLMRCAMGICGSCVIGKYRVCRDGPVFGPSQLSQVENELGKFKRALNGEKIPITSRLDP